MAKIRKLCSPLISVVVIPLLAAPACAAEPTSQAESSNFIFFVINFVAFVFLITKYAGPVIRDYFRTRAQAIRLNFSNAEQVLLKAQQQANNIKALVAQLETEKKQIAEEIRLETEHEVAEILRRAENLAKQIRQEGERTAQATAQGAERKLKALIAHNAVEAARALIREHFKRADQERLIEDFVQRITLGINN